jgi:putative methionine-R-sulfoxide reductase with GAF domain
MSSFPLPDNSNITNAPEEPRETEHGTPQCSPITPSQGQESAGPRLALQAILEQAMERTAAAGAAIVLGTDNAVCCRASTGAPAPEVGARLHAGVSITRLCLGTGEILVCNDTNTDRRVDPQLCKERGIRSLLVLPIKQKAKVVGVLEVMSILPNSFNQHDAAAMSKLADQVLPLLSESATISGRLDQLPNKDIDAVRDFQELWGHTDVPKENNNLLPTTDAAEVAESNGPYIGSQLPHQTVIMRGQEHRSGAHWLRIGLAATFALGLIGYGYHLSRPRVATYGAILSMGAANHKLAPPRQDVLSLQNNKVNGQPKALDSVLTATTQETILAIQEPVQGTDVNRNRANAGDSVAQNEMALRYADGEGVPQNYQDAMAWFAKAAANGNDNAQWKLGLGYMKGIGVPHDERKAVVWFKRAANQGDIRAQNALSDAYLNGRGIPRDYVRAYTWAGIAAGLQGKDSDRLSLIGSRMTAVQIVDAHRRISIWWERRSRRPDIPASSQRTAMPHVSDK